MQCELVRVYIIVIIITNPVSQFVGGTKQRVEGAWNFSPDLYDGKRKLFRVEIDVEIFFSAENVDQIFDDNNDLRL